MIDRFAGTRIEGLLGDKPNYGKIASAASTIRSKEGQAATDLMSQTAATGISTAGRVEGEARLADAEVGLAQAQTNAALMQTIGKVSGAAINAFPTGGGWNLGDAYEPKFDASKVWSQPMEYSFGDFMGW